MEKKKILVIDDDETVRTQMGWALADDFEVLLASGGHKAMEVIKSESPGVVTLDLGLPPSPSGTEEGMRLLASILGQQPDAKVIVITGTTEKEAALKAISRGAHDYLAKPINTDELRTIARRASFIHGLENECRRTAAELVSQPLAGAIGDSPAMREVFSIVRKTAASGVPVLLLGESGTGKEVMARALHHESARSKGPFVAINCGAIPLNLLESELFGFEKGAFTGANASRRGRVEAAAGGTLFLDEIAELPLELQVKMLRFLQDHMIERVGGRGPIPVDVRIVAATNRDIKRLILEGRFREDLYFRLAVVCVELPPLRKRGGDIVKLAEMLLKKLAGRKRRLCLCPEAVEAMVGYHWPGNVRELENKIKRAVTFADGPVITPRDLGLSAASGRTGLDFKKAREDLENSYVIEAIEKHNGNISRAARELGLSRPTVHQIMKKNNLIDTARKG